MQHKASELEGALLDAAVAKAEGLNFAIELHMTTTPKPAACWLRDDQGKPLYTHGLYSPSTRWEQAGPIIERERMNVVLIRPGEWWAEPASESMQSLEGVTVATSPKGESGPTPLIAAMRAYVASKLGDLAELP